MPGVLMVEVCPDSLCIWSCFVSRSYWSLIIIKFSLQHHQRG
jgi:hypothetical protein